MQDNPSDHNGPVPKRRRFPKAERRRQMVEAAAKYFAEHGFEGSTRDLARELDVDQALIYRHFESKDALVVATLEHVFEQRQMRADIGDDDRPIRQLLLDRYSKMVSSEGGTPILLQLRAALAGVTWPDHKRFTQTGGFMLTVIEKLRAEAGLPKLEDVPLMNGERELVITLHASFFYLAMRRHVLPVDLPDDLSDIVDLYIDNFLASAPDNLRRLHAEGRNTLTASFFGPAADPEIVTR